MKRRSQYFDSFSIDSDFDAIHTISKNIAKFFEFFLRKKNGFISNLLKVIVVKFGDCFKSQFIDFFVAWIFRRFSEHFVNIFDKLDFEKD